MGDALGADRDRGLMVLRLWPFFERIVAHDKCTAIRGFDQIAGCTVRAVRDGAADHFGAQCPGFDRMTLPSVREVRILDAQQIDVFDIDSVRARPGADAVFVKIAVADRDRRSRRAAEETGLIVYKLDCVYYQTAFDQTNTCAVHVGHTDRK